MLWFCSSVSVGRPCEKCFVRQTIIYVGLVVDIALESGLYGLVKV